MPTVKLAAHADDILSRYRNGESAASLAREYQATTTTVTSLLKKLGVMPSLQRGEADATVRSDATLAANLFVSGVRPCDIYSKLSKPRSKSWLYSVLKKTGGSLRGLGNWRPSGEMVERMSKTRERNGKMNRAERTLCALLAESGIEAKAQVSLGRGNADFVIPSHSVAVELLGRGTYRLYIRNGWIEKRIRELRERGWHAYFMVVTATRGADGIARHGIDDLLAWLDFMKRQPAVRRQYRMVRCPGELLAAGCSDDHQFPFVEALR